MQCVSASHPDCQHVGLLLAGGSSATTGVWYDDVYDRDLWPPGLPCVPGFTGPGTEVQMASNVDLDGNQLCGGLDLAAGGCTPRVIDPKTLPMDHNCKPVYPHQYVKVNTVVEVINSQQVTGVVMDPEDLALGVDLAVPSSQGSCCGKGMLLCKR